MKKLFVLLCCVVMFITAKGQSLVLAEVPIGGQQWEIVDVIDPQTSITFRTLRLKDRTIIDENVDTPWAFPEGDDENTLLTIESSYTVNGTTYMIDAVEQNALYRCPYTKVYLRFLTANPKSYIDPYLFYSKFHEDGVDTRTNYYKVNKRLKTIFIGADLDEYNTITAKYVTWAGKNNNDVIPVTDIEGVAAYYDLNVHGLCGSMEGLTTLGPLGTEDGTVIIPYGVTDISADAFYNTKIRKVKFVSPETLTKISLGAFNRCSELEQLEDMNGNLPAFDNLENIGFAAFNSCSKLKAFTGSNLDKLENIENVAFRYTKSMTQFAGENFYGKALRTIEAGAFLYSGIRTFSTPVSQGASLPELTSIGVRAFFGCPNLTHFSISGQGQDNLPKLQTVDNWAFAAQYKNESYIPPRLSDESETDYALRVDMAALQADFPKMPSRLVAWGANVNETGILRLKQSLAASFYTVTIKLDAFAYCDKLDVLKLKHVDAIFAKAFYNVNPKVVYAYMTNPTNWDQYGFARSASNTSFLVDDEDLLSTEGNNIPKFGTLRFDDNTYLPVGAGSVDGATVLTEAQAKSLNQQAMRFKASPTFSVFSPMFYLSEAQTDNRMLASSALTFSNKSFTGTYSLNVYRTFNVGSSNYSSLALPFAVTEAALKTAASDDLWQVSGLGNAFRLYGVSGSTVLFKSPSSTSFTSPAFGAAQGGHLWLVNYRNGASGDAVSAGATLRCLAEMDNTFNQSQYDVRSHNGQTAAHGNELMVRGTTNVKSALWSSAADSDKALFVYTNDGWKRVFTVAARQSKIKPFRFVLLVTLNSDEQALQTKIDNAVTAYKAANGGRWDGNMNVLQLDAGDIAAAKANLNLGVDTDVVTAIGSVEAVQHGMTNPKIYNLQGKYVGTDFEALPQGMYIVNGKKVIRR